MPEETTSSSQAPLVLMSKEVIEELSEGIKVNTITNSYETELVTVQRISPKPSKDAVVNMEGSHSMPAKIVQVTSPKGSGKDERSLGRGEQWNQEKERKTKVRKDGSVYMQGKEEDHVHPNRGKVLRGKSMWDDLFPDESHTFHPHRLFTFFFLLCAWGCFGFLAGLHWALLSFLQFDVSDTKIHRANSARRCAVNCIWYWGCGVIVALGNAWCRGSWGHARFTECEGEPAAEPGTGYKGTDYLEGPQMSSYCYKEQQSPRYRFVYTSHYVILAFSCGRWVFDLMHLWRWSGESRIEFGTGFRERKGKIFSMLWETEPLHIGIFEHDSDINEIGISMRTKGSDQSGRPWLFSYMVRVSLFVVLITTLSWTLVIDWSTHPERGGFPDNEKPVGLYELLAILFAESVVTIAVAVIVLGYSDVGKGIAMKRVHIEHSQEHEYKEWSKKRYKARQKQERAAEAAGREKPKRPKGWGFVGSRESAAEGAPGERQSENFAMKLGNFLANPFHGARVSMMSSVQSAGGVPDAAIQENDGDEFASIESDSRVTMDDPNDPASASNQPPPTTIGNSGNPSRSVTGSQGRGGIWGDFGSASDGLGDNRA